MHAPQHSWHQQCKQCSAAARAAPQQLQAAAPLNVTSGSCGNSGDSLCSPTSTTKGIWCLLAASATVCTPAGAMTPPLASTACAPTSTCSRGAGASRRAAALSMPAACLCGARARMHACLCSWAAAQAQRPAPLRRAGRQAHLVGARHHGKHRRVGDERRVHLGVGQLARHRVAVVARRVLRHHHLAAAACAAAAPQRRSAGEGRRALCMARHEQQRERRA